MKLFQFTDHPGPMPGAWANPDRRIIQSSRLNRFAKCAKIPVHRNDQARVRAFEPGVVQGARFAMQALDLGHHGVAVPGVGDAMADFIVVESGGFNGASVGSEPVDGGACNDESLTRKPRDQISSPRRWCCSSVHG